MKRLLVFVVLGFLTIPDLALARVRVHRAPSSRVPSNPNPPSSAPSNPEPSNPPPSNPVPSNPTPSNSRPPEQPHLDKEQLNQALRESKAKAEQLFPDLKIQGSAIRTEADRLIREHVRLDPNFMLQPDAPLLIAHEAHFNLTKRASAAVTAPESQAAPSTNKPAQGPPGSAENPTYLITVRGNDTPRSNEEDWLIEADEVYKFVRFVSQSEYRGDSTPTNDRSFVLVRMDDVVLVEPVGTFKIPDDLKVAEARYHAFVQQKLRDDEAWILEIVQRRRDASFNVIRAELRRTRQLQEQGLFNGNRR